MVRSGARARRQSTFKVSAGLAAELRPPFGTRTYEVASARGRVPWPCSREWGVCDEEAPMRFALCACAVCFGGAARGPAETRESRSSLWRFLIACEVPALPASWDGL
jgi:hypothetical protein